MARGHEHVVEADVRIPDREAQARIHWMKPAEDVNVSGVEDDLDRVPANAPAAQPDERPQPRRQLAEIQHVPRSEGVEVAGQQVKAAVVRPDGAQQRVQLEGAVPLGPRRVDGAEMDAEHREVDAGGVDFEKGMARDARPVPEVIGDALPAHEAERGLRLRAALRHPAPGRDALDNRGVGGFLKDDEIGVTGGDDGGDLLFPAAAPMADVVGQQAEAHAPSVFIALSMSTRYGCPSSSPRTYITKSRVAWMLT